MKKLSLIFALLLSLAFTASAQVSSAVLKAQSIIKTELAKSNINVYINDKSVQFNKDNTDFWITITGAKDPLLYTLYTKGLTFKETQALTSEERQQIALQAAQIVCVNTHIKVYMEGGTLHFDFPAYASTPNEYVACLNSYIREFSSVRKKFDEAFKKCEKEYLRQKEEAAAAAAAAIPVILEDTTILVVEQPYEAEPVSNDAPVKITGMDIHTVTQQGSEISGYNQGIRRSQCMFVQPKIFVLSDKAGTHTINVRIYTPKGRLMVPYKDATYTTSTTIDVKKSKKAEEYTLKKFGYANPATWEAGEYRIEFFENGVMLYQDTFTVL